MKNFIRESTSSVDVVAWVVSVLFFVGSALLFDGDVAPAALGAVGVVVVMFLVGTSIEVLIETLKNIPRIGTITGFLTNGPEALVLVVGLLSEDILFAASTPLGSNFMNPLLLIIAALLMRHFLMVWRVAPRYLALTVFLTASIAGGFYLISAQAYPIWVATALVVSVVLFALRPKEEVKEEEEELAVSKYWLIPSVAILMAAGYFLDPVVAFASEASQAPKGVIGFVVLSTLTSWPEFKSCLALLRRNMAVASVLNIVVSNITNLWLAVGGVVVFLFM